MKTYASILFNEGYNTEFSCLFEIKYDPEITYTSGKRSVIILNIIIGNDELVFNKIDDRITWSWLDNGLPVSKYYNEVISYIDRITELEDEESAILWYRMNY